MKQVTIAIAKLRDASTMAPSYLTLAGTSAGQGVIFERIRRGVDRCLALDEAWCNFKGKALAREAIRQFGLKAGDHAIVMVPIGDYARAQREDGARIIFEEHGMTVTVVDGDPK